MSSLKKALGYSAVESVGSRVFDFVNLWIVLNTLPTSDLAKFGLATSALFFFNLVFVVPETALLRYQKQWTSDGSLNEAISSYLFFSSLKIACHLLLCAAGYFYFDGFHWFVYAVVFSLITQQIQLAEIVRIYLRMELQQRRVARFELVSKSVLFLGCLTLFKHPSLNYYFAIYFVWSLLVALVWLKNLAGCIELKLLGARRSMQKVLESMVGFSLWSQISGVLTFYIYNSSILFLGLFSAPEHDIALYTSISKVANLFFVIPMFFQAFVPVTLANSAAGDDKKFGKLLLAGGTLSFGQFLFFLCFGKFLAPFFGVKGMRSAHDFYLLGIIINSGILLLNLSRPLSTYLLIRGSPRKVMACVFIPSAVLATALYAVGAMREGIYGCAIGSAIAYAFMATMFLVLYKGNKSQLANGAWQS